MLAPSTPLRLALEHVAVALAAATLVVVVLLHDGLYGGLWQAYTFPLLGVLYAATGLVAWQRRPANRLGALLVATGGAWLATGLGNTSNRVLIAIGEVLATVPIAMVVHLLHAFPGGRLHGRSSRWAVAGAYATALVLQAPLWAFAPEPPPFDLLVLSARPDLARLGVHVQQAAGAVVVLVTIAVLVDRLRQYDAQQRRIAAPLLGYGVVAVLAIPLAADVLRPLGVDPANLVAVQAVVVAGVPLGFLAVVLRGGFARTGELAALVASVAQSEGSQGELEHALAAALGDPGARMLHWCPSQGAYLDGRGLPVVLPADRAAVQVEAGGRRLAAIVYDPLLDADPAAVEAVGRVAAIALERDRLAREVVRSRRALREASVRLLGDDDRQRRRIARDLHDGLQVALVRLSMQAHRLAAEPGDAPELAARLAHDVDQAAASLRALVHGVMPAQLVERGLVAAVQDLAYGLPVRTRLEADGLPRLPAPVESTVYFVVAEALTNVVKHAAAAEVRVRLDINDGVLGIAVADDGHGGDVTTTSGSGLAGLRDRLEVLGGSLDVSSTPDGTVLSARLPAN